MKKKNIKPLILSSLAAVAMAGIGTGATFALFTDKAETQINVEAGKVKIKSEYEFLNAYSMDPADNKKSVERTQEQGFVTGGTFVFDNDTGVATLTNMVPGDGISFKAKFTNESNVAIKYRFYVKTLNDSGLFAGLKIKFGDTALAPVGGVWKNLEKEAAFPTTELTDGTVSIELPKEAGNEYQGKTCQIVIGYEAVQGNADVVDTWNGTNYEHKTVKDYLYKFGGFGTKSDSTDYSINAGSGFLAIEREREDQGDDFAKYILKPTATITPGSNGGRAVAAESDSEYNTALANAQAYVNSVESIPGFAADKEAKKITISSAEALQALNMIDVYFPAKTMLEYDATDSIFNAYYYDNWSCEVTESIDLGNQEWQPVSVTRNMPIDFKDNYVANLKVTQIVSGGGLFASARGISNLYLEHANIHVSESDGNAQAAAVVTWNLGNTLNNITVSDATIVAGGTCGILSAANYGGEMNNNLVINSSARSLLDHEVGALTGIYNSASDVSYVQNNTVVKVSLEAYDREVASLIGRYYADGNHNRTLKVKNTTLKNVSLKVAIQTSVSETANQGNEANKYLGIYIGGRFAENNTVEFADNHETNLVYDGGTVIING